MRRVILLSTFLVLFYIVHSAFAQQISGLDIERIQRATVFVMQARASGDQFIVTCVSSGTLVTRTGLILTNAHSIIPTNTCPGDTLIIALSTRLDEPPVPKYQAAIAQANPGLDLALLRVIRELDGRLIEPDALTLPFVELADSERVQLDETITVVGFPGIGDDPVTMTRGTVIGFTAEPSGGDKSWIKTRAEIPGTMSGGGAYNQTGELIGIPTSAPISAQTVNTTCQPIQDTNQDGLVNTNDACIPVGGFINALRPSNFARPLIRAASLGLSVDTLTTSNIQSASGGTPGFRRLFFSPAVNEAGLPTTVIRSLPAGSNSLFLFFDHLNMTPETVYELRVTTDGIPNPIFSLTPVRWSGGERGLWYLGNSGQPWPNGIYEFTLLANGIAAETARLVIGSAPESAPAFSDIVFGLLDLQGNVLGNGYVLPTGSAASARFIYRNMADGTPWTAIWFYNGNEIFRTPEETVWSDGESGSKTISIEDSNGLLPGIYRLELYIENRLAATSDFTIAGAQEGAFPRAFSNTSFTVASTPDEARTAAGVSNFPSTVDSLYIRFDWQQVATGTPWTMRWTVDDDIFYEQTRPWSAPEDGQGYLIRLTSPEAIPDGTYRVDFFVNQIQLASAQAQVGIGQLPIDRFAQASGVQLRGQILDSDTNQGIPGATLVLLSEEFSVEDFVWNQNQIYALAVTDRNGRFQIDRPLELSIGEDTIAYSVIIVAEGYLPITQDGLTVTPETANPLDLTIELTHD
jgi:S1-C subfamily serine protease